MRNPSTDLRLLPASLLIMCVLASGGRSIQAQAPADGHAAAPIGVSHYDAYLEPDPDATTIKGLVVLTLTRHSTADTLILDCGELVIDSVDGNGVPLAYEVSARRLRIRLPRETVRRDKVTVRYHGAPRSGLVFTPKRRIMYTLFSTSQWMVAVDAPGSRASFRLRLVVPKGWTVVSNGRKVGQRMLSEQTELSEWRQDRPTPTYLFGFVAGQLSGTTQRAGGVALDYFASGLSAGELQRVFGHSGRMLEFFQERAGVAYPGARYAQVVVPRTAGQEMMGFSVVSEEFARAVLDDPSSDSLIAHELAHQWWGNMVTCRTFTHFWLNEGFATFMAAAYREHQFGRDVYLKDIERMRARYERVRDAGHDRSLVFQDWDRPTPDDRTLVYQKGGYVLHLLRELLGEQAFWAGIRRYTRDHFGGSVITDDFRHAMEQVSGRDLGAFFGEWIEY
jgi:aminopeptidase N